MNDLEGDEELVTVALKEGINNAIVDFAAQLKLSDDVHLSAAVARALPVLAEVTVFAILVAARGERTSVKDFTERTVEAIYRRAANPKSAEFVSMLLTDLTENGPSRPND